ncbi:STAS domain-containing protein [Cupriavidus sp. AU9028]|nr:STAS domain-containing protein [Cupriavidus sp. AU9028]
MATATDTLLALFDGSIDEISEEWTAEYQAYTGAALSGNAVRGDQHRLVQTLREILRAGADIERFDSPEWAALRHLLADLSASRAAQGETADVTSGFVLALKRPVFARLQRQQGGTQDQINAIWAVSRLIDRMAQWTVSTYQRTREEIIVRQQHELLELSTPVIKLWDGVLAVPIIGTLDSSRAQLIMETLLERIVHTGAEIAIIDITGVPTVDTLVAQHLMKTVTAIRLMGADSIISGIRPQIAQTIVHLGIDLQGIKTKSTLADALALAMARTGNVVGNTAAQ